jgi:hypothetical protein
MLIADDDGKNYKIKSSGRLMVAAYIRRQLLFKSADFGALDQGGG